MATCTETSVMYDDRDHISELHESVLSHILSRLPTEEAVRTCILSKDWSHKWTSLYNFGVVIPYKYNSDHVVKNRLTNFLDTTLPSCKFLKSFRLIFLDRYYPVDSCRVHTWISTALRHNLESIVVHCFVSGLVYSCSLLNTDSLRILDLRFEYGIQFTLNVEAKNIAANLSSLNLKEVRIMNESPDTNTVMLSFPVLKTCKVDCCRWLNLKFVEIYAPLLIAFISAPEAYDPYFPIYDDVIPYEEYIYSIILNAPRLATITCDPDFPERISLNGTGSSVVHANLYCAGGDPDDHLREKNNRVRAGNILKQLSNLEELELPCMANNVGEASELGACSDKLRRLNLIGCWNPRQISHMLQAVPPVKILRLGLVVDCEGEIERVPSCTISQLEEVEFYRCSCIWSECPEHYEYAKLLLKKGERLKKITVAVSPCLYKINRTRCDDTKVIDTLLKFPRCNSSLIIQ